MAETISRDPPMTQRGKCEMCGGHDRELYIMFVGDYVGWTCLECIDQLQHCQIRRFMPPCEETEPYE